jgi:hypothetical protein
MKTSSWGVQRKKRDYIEVWVFLLLLFSVNFFDLLPITRVIGPNGPFTFYLISLFLVFTFHRRAWIRDSARWLIPFWWFLLGIVLSYVPALLNYGQSFTQSFFTNRRIFEFTAFPILIALRPTERELRTSLYAFSVVYLFFTLFVTFLAQDWVYVPAEASFIEEGDFVHNLSGVRNALQHRPGGGRKLIFMHRMARREDQPVQRSIRGHHRPEASFPCFGHCRGHGCRALFFTVRVKPAEDNLQFCPVRARGKRCRHGGQEHQQRRHQRSCLFQDSPLLVVHVRSS